MSIFDVRITVHDIVDQCMRDNPTLSSVDCGAALRVARTTLRYRDYAYLVSLANPYTHEPGLPIALYASREKAQDRCVAEGDKRRCTVYVMAIQDGCILREEYYYPGDQA